MTKTKLYRISLLSLFTMILLIIGFTFAGGLERNQQPYNEYFDMIKTTQESYSKINYGEKDTGFIIRGKETSKGNFLLKYKETNEEIRCFEQLNGFYINSNREIGEKGVVPLSESTLKLGINNGKFKYLYLDGGFFTTCISLDGKNIINPDAVFGHIGYSTEELQITPKNGDEGTEEIEIIIDNNNILPYQVRAGIDFENEETRFNDKGLVLIGGEKDISAEGTIRDNRQGDLGNAFHGNGYYEGYRERYRGSANTRNLEFLPPARSEGEDPVTWNTTGTEINIRVYGITGYTREISGDIIEGKTGIFESNSSDTIVKLTEGIGTKNIQYFGYSTSMQDDQRVHTQTYNITLQPIPEIFINNPENDWATSKQVSATGRYADSMYYSTGTNTVNCDIETMSLYTQGAQIILDTEYSNNKYVSFFAVNNGGGTSCAGIRINKIDTTPPTYGLEYNNNNIECSTGTITITNAQDATGIGLHTQPYGWNGIYGNSATYSSYMTEPGTQNIHINVRDGLGNTSEETINLVRHNAELQLNTSIKDLGTLMGTNIRTNVAGDFGSHAGECETITQNIIDNDNATCTLTNNQLTIEPLANYNGNGYCTISFTDGETTKTGKYVFTISTSQPGLELELNPSSTEWTRNTINVNMSATNANGAKYLIIGAAGVSESTCRTSGNPLTSSQDNPTYYQGEVTISNNGTNYLYLCAKSLTDEINMISGIYKIDQAGPTGYITYTNTNGGVGNSCTTGNIIVTLNAGTSISGYPERAFARNSTDNRANNNTLTTTENGSGTGYIRDNAGNILALPYYVTGIVTNGPTTPTLNTPLNNHISNVGNITFSWDESIGNNCATIENYYIYIKSGNTVVQSANTTNTTITLELENGNYSRYVIAKDSFQQISQSEERSLVISNQAPTCSIEYTPAENLGLTSSNVRAILTGCSEGTTGFNSTGHLFTSNGSYEFTFQNENNIHGNYIASVNWIDNIPPVLSEITTIGTTTDTTPDYTFTSTEQGTISYNGSCNGNTTQAVSGENTITFNQLGIGYYPDCSIIVTDTVGNASTLNITPFTITEHSAPTTTLIGWGMHAVPSMRRQDITVDIIRYEGAAGGVIISDTNDVNSVSRHLGYTPVTTGRYTMQINNEDKNGKYVCAFGTTGGLRETICSEYPIKIDISNPSLQLISPINGSNFNSGNTVTLQWSGHDEPSGISGYTLKIIDSDSNIETYYYDPQTTSKTYTINKSGTWQRSITVNDIVGHTVQETGTFVVPYPGGNNGSGGEHTSGFNLISPTLGDQINLGENVILTRSPGTTNNGYEREVKNISGTVIASGYTTSLTATVNDGLFTTGAYSWSVKDIASETTKTIPLFYIVDSQNIPDLKVAQFEFDEIEDAKLDEYYQSTTITIKGLSNNWYSYAYLQDGIGALYINDKFVGTDGFVKNGDEIFIEMKASDEYNKTVKTTLVIGGGTNTVSGNFKITTKNGINSRDEGSLTPMQKLWGIIFVDSLVEMYQYNEEKLATFLSTFMQLLQDKSDYYAREIQEAENDGDESLTKEYKLYKDAIDFLYITVKYRYDNLEVEDHTVYIAPNGKQYLVEYDEDRMAYTSPDFARPKYFPTRNLFTNHIDINNPAVGKWGIIGNVVTAHNGKVYTIYETNGKWTSSNFKTAKYFDTKEDIINHILANNPASNWNHTIDTDFEEVRHTAPNGRVYKIFKTSSKGNNPDMYSSYDFVNAKYFTSLEAAKKFIDQNNKKK